jgi:hypothetical protein
MGKTFDELYGDFFKKNDETPKKRKRKDNIIDMLTNPNKLEEHIDNLGKPDKVEFYNEGIIFFEKRTWYTKHGDVVKIIIYDEPSLNIPPFEEKPLEEQLYDAVVEENFEKAAVLRDLIANEKKIRNNYKNT